MKYLLYLTLISLIFISCSKSKIDPPKAIEPEQNVFYYDSLWQRAEADRILPANTSHNSTIIEQYKVQGRTYHLANTHNGGKLCEYDGTNWVQCAVVYTRSIVKHKNTLYLASAYVETGRQLETKVLDPGSFTFTDYSQAVPADFDDNIQYYTNLTSINNELYLILISSTENNISALKFNETTHTWEVAVLKHTISGSQLLHSRMHEGLAGETLISGQTTAGEFVFKFNGSSFEVIHELSNYTIVQGDGYFDIIPYKGKYIIADGASGTLNYLDGMTATSEAFPPQGQIQHFTIKDNYACVATGTVSQTDYGIMKFRFYNLTNNKIAVFNSYVYEYGQNFRITRMEAPWFDYTFQNGEIQMLGAANIVYANFTSARAAIKLVMPVGLP